MPLLDELQATEPFCQLDGELLQRLAQAAELRTFPPQHYLLEQGATAAGTAFWLRRGLVELTRPGEDGEDVVVDYRAEGSLIGDAALLDLPGEPAAARTSSHTECLLLPVDLLREALHSCPAFTLSLARGRQAQLGRLYDELVKRQSQRALHQVETYPFRRRLSEIMSVPVETCRPDDTAHEAARRMSQRRIRSLAVVGGDGHLIGIITTSDLLARGLVPAGRHFPQTQVGQIMTPHPISLAPDTYMYEAMAYMTAHRIHHLPVVEEGRPVGMVSLTDLMRYRSQPAMLLVGRVQDAADLATLAAAKQELPHIADVLLRETRNAPEVMEMLSHIHHQIIRRVYELCLEEMRRRGQEPPAVRCCFLLMGSGGRREMLLSPDQDHGLLYEDVPEEEMPEVEAFYAPFAGLLSDALNQVGYPYCDGKVMASNPVWRGRLQDWRRQVTDWMATPEPQKVRNTSIFLDFIPLVGDSGLAHQLQELVRQSLQAYPGFLYQMMSLDLTHKVPLGLFGRFVTENEGGHRGQISLKRSASVYIVDCIRMLALSQEVLALTTLDRLDALRRRNLFTPETAEQIRMAFEALAFLRLQQEVACIQRGEAPDHFIDPARLPRADRELLRAALRVVDLLQETTRRHFGKTA